MKKIEESPTALDIERRILESAAKSLEVSPASLDPAEEFTSYGLDSIAAFAITCELAEWLGRDLEASLFWEYSTVSELAEHLAGAGDEAGN